MEMAFVDSAASGDDTTSAESDKYTFKLVHSVPGRLRLKSGHLYRRPDRAVAIEQRLLADETVIEATANPVTGSLLIRYRSTAEADSIIERLGAQLAPTGFTSRRRPSLTMDDAKPAPLKLIARLMASIPNWKPAPDRVPPSPAAPALPDPEAPPWHNLDTATALSRCNSGAKGISTEDALQRLARYGPNRLPEVSRRSPLAMFIEQFNSLPVWLLGASAVVSVMTGGIVDACVILAVVLINAGIGFVTERQAERTIEALNQVAAEMAQVVRDGATHRIRACDVVVGDILELNPGQAIAADARLLSGSRLSTDESSLTGESMPVDKTPATLPIGPTPLADRHNMVYMGSVVTGGSGQALVVATGAATEIGRIQSLAGDARPPPTPMQQQLDKMGLQLGILSGLICIGVFGIGIWRGYGTLQMLTSSISLAVAAVPEGLPTIATTILAMGIRDMRRHRVLVRHLGAVETLGSVQVLCLDKTGTLTLNRMTATEVQIGSRHYDIRDGQFLHEGEALDPLTDSSATRFLQVLALCNESSCEGHDGARRYQGSPTENALLELALYGGLDIDQLRSAFPRQRIKYRAEGRPYMSTSHACPDQSHLVAVKGHPMVLLEHCDRIFEHGHTGPLTDEMRRAIVQENERMSGNALRVLGVAFSTEPVNSDTPLIWLGLAGLTDPIRPEMRELIEQFHNAGIRTVMITGDQAGTATAIGQQLQLSREGRSLQVLESTRLDDLDENLLAGLAQRVHVFARVSPAHKLKIVQALQKSGQVVAMTGDGINDGPALKAANIGVAMGHSGTEVARSVSDIVLEDDNLHTKLVAISEGRTIYNNIRKSLHFLLSTNLSEIEVMLAGVAMGTTAPLNPMQLLWINLITDIFPGLALAMEKPEPDIMSQPPRDPGESILRKQDLKEMGIQSGFITAGALGGYGYGLWRYGGGPSASTLAFMTLTLAQLLHALSCRSDHHSLFDRNRLPPNPYLRGALLASIGVQLVTPFVPGLRGLLGLGPIRPLDAAVIAGGATLPLLINEAMKKRRLLRQERPLAALPAQEEPPATPGHQERAR